MNVYDFDNTIYAGDSTLDFYFYCLKKEPKILMCLPKQLFSALKYKCKKISKTQFKQEFYCFFKLLDDIDDKVHEFWDLNQKKIKDWYKIGKKDDDVIITASPEFLIQEICKRMEISILIASKVNLSNGQYKGLNCYGQEKVKRFYEVFPDGKIDKFYSDSKSDLPIATLAEKAYLVKENHIEEWKK